MAFTFGNLSRRSKRAAARLALAAGLLALVVSHAPASADTVEPIHVFKGAHHGGVMPQGALLQASDGKLWGATSEGGEGNDGIIFRIALDGTYESVTGVPLWQGRNFVGDLVQTEDGTLWAVTTYGGDYDAGSILAVGLDGAISLVYSFNPAGWGGHPNGGLLKASDGKLYGVIPEDTELRLPGAVYRLDPATRGWTIVATLPSDCVYYDGGRLVEGSDGAFYGVRRGQGGCIFRVTPRGTAKVIHKYSKGNRFPQDIVAASDGNLYITFDEWLSRNRDCSGVARMTLSGKSTTINIFPCPNGQAYPQAGIMQDSHGMLRGSLSHLNDAGNAYVVTTWKMALDGTSFSETRVRPRSGQYMQGLTEASDGNFYTTAAGGKYGEGTIVKVSP